LVRISGRVQQGNGLDKTVSQIVLFQQ
jgi:hypothetical protein